MQSAYQNQTVLVGRILLGLIFVLSGIGKIAGFEGTVGYVAKGGLPMPELVAALTILIELGGGLMLVFGFFTRWAAFALAVFTILAALVFHNFWTATDAMRMGQETNFLKNLSIAGGMLVLAMFGPGAFSVDAKRGMA
jgi:putative oxidoreductase